MEIKKADSKGRITVGERGESYFVRRYSTGAVLLEPVANEMVVRFPVPEKAIQYLRDCGLDPHSVSVDGVDRYGYFLARGTDKTRQDWPAEFSWEEFRELVG